MDDREKVIEAFRSSDEPLNAKKVSEISGVDKKEVDKIMKDLKKDETIVSPKRCYWTSMKCILFFTLNYFFNIPVKLISFNYCFIK